MKRRAKILLVDDDDGIRLAVTRYLRARGYDVAEAANCRAAEAATATAGVDLVILDQRLPDGTGLEFLPRLRLLVPQAPVIMLTAHGTIDVAVQAIKEGADQFLTKPVDLEALTLLLDRLIEARRDRQKQLAVRPCSSLPNPFLAESDAVRRLADEARQAAETDRPVLILGETGTGKGVLARWLHDAGPRTEEAFVDLNCAGISRELLDSELFGHDVGAFTGAVKARAGLLEVAHRGSLFLDEVGDMDVGIQARLLKVLEEKRFRRLGDTRDRFVDVRLVAATHQDLGRLIAERRFREDLYFRISALELRIPPLRARAEDIQLLARQILDAFAREVGRAAPDVSLAALAVLKAYHWPGNVRELRNVLETAAIRNRSGAIHPEDLRLRPASTREPGAAIPSLAEVERAHLQRALAAMDGHVARTAKALGISTSSLYERLKRFEITTGRPAQVVPGAATGPADGPGDGAEGGR